MQNTKGYLAACESHFDRLIQASPGTVEPMWPSVVDVRIGRCPDGDIVPRRVYRAIGAPRGSTLYWDQPLLVSAYVLSVLAGETRFAQAADDYVNAFLNRCVAENGMFRWGNHQYYDMPGRKIVEFSGGHHELRPLTPAWDVFWRLAPEHTAAYIRLMSRLHLYDPLSGGFNRHDDGKKGHAFLEAGGILCESLAWLSARTGDESLIETALRVARYSFDHRDPVTGLLPNEPDMDRWDSKVCTSEVGLWARSLLRAANYTGHDVFNIMARDAVFAYLSCAFDPDRGRFFGQLNIRDGNPVFPSETGYWPGPYANPWNTDQWPTHDYPMAVAETCLSLFAITGGNTFAEGIRRFAGIVMEGRPARTGTWAYADNYGRCIHFLARAGLELDEKRFFSDAHSLADEAVTVLFENGMFQGYPGGHLYESVDGVGFLLLALMFLETRKPFSTYGFGF